MGGLGQTGLPSSVDILEPVGNAWHAIHKWIRADTHAMSGHSSTVCAFYRPGLQNAELFHRTE